MKKLLLLILLPLFIFANRFEQDIRNFEQADQRSFPRGGSTLFIGSSSIRMWNTLHQDFSDLSIIQRGFGGSTASDINHFRNRIMINYNPKQIVIYSGENDLDSHKSAQDVFKDFQNIFWHVHQKLDIKIILISVKVAPARTHLKQKIQNLNSLLKEESIRNSRIQFVDLTREMHDSNGSPREELYLEDRIHLNRKGYLLWINKLKNFLY